MITDWKNDPMCKSQEKFAKLICTTVGNSKKGAALCKRSTATTKKCWDWVKKRAEEEPDHFAEAKKEVQAFFCKSATAKVAKNCTAANKKAWAGSSKYAIYCEKNQDKADKMCNADVDQLSEFKEQKRRMKEIRINHKARAMCNDFGALGGASCAGSTNPLCAHIKKTTQKCLDYVKQREENEPDHAAEARKDVQAFHCRTATKKVAENCVPANKSKGDIWWNIHCVKQQAEKKKMCDTSKDALAEYARRRMIRVQTKARKMCNDFGALGGASCANGSGGKLCSFVKKTTQKCLDYVKSREENEPDHKAEATKEVQAWNCGRWKKAHKENCIPANKSKGETWWKIRCTNAAAKIKAQC